MAGVSGTKLCPKLILEGTRLTQRDLLWRVKA
jgi:hypothetical protein